MQAIKYFESMQLCERLKFRKEVIKQTSERRFNRIVQEKQFDTFEDFITTLFIIQTSEHGEKYWNRIIKKYSVC